MHSFFEPLPTLGNVVFNFRGRAINDLRAFVAGYHEAGKALIDQMLSTAGYRDYEGYPILFLYRHGLELYLKAIVYRGAQLAGVISDKQFDTEKLWSRHELTPLLPHVESIFKCLGWEWDFEVSGLKSFDDFATLIKAIEGLDPRSYCFRYPVNTKGEAALPKHFIVNVISFGRKMDPVLELLDAAVTGLEEEWQATAEALYNLREFFCDSNGEV
jgi:hypothetical protein